MSENNKNSDIMVRVRVIFANSGLTLEKLGNRMGHSGAHARQHAWYFLNTTNDPKLSTLQRFADALGISLKDIIK